MGFKESLEIKANRTLVSLARPTQGGEGLVTLIYTLLVQAYLKISVIIVKKQLYGVQRSHYNL